MSKIADLNLPHLYMVPPLGPPLEFRRDFGIEKLVSGLLVSYNVVCVILSLAIFVGLRLVTDGQTDADGKHRASTVSRLARVSRNCNSITRKHDRHDRNRKLITQLFLHAYCTLSMAYEQSKPENMSNQ